MKEKFFFECLNMGHGVSARMHFSVWGEFAFHFLQNYTVKWLENKYSNRQAHTEQEYIDRMSKPVKEHFVWVFEYYSYL